MNAKKVEPRKTFPALRCQMGDWIYYVTYMKFSDVNYWIKKTDQIHQSEKLREMIQREITPRVAPIAEYLLEQPERFFNSIVVGVYDGDPEWYPLEISGSSTLGTAKIDNDIRYSVGLLVFEGSERLFAIDGQHRVEAIKDAIYKKPDLSKEDQSAIFVSHKTDERGRKRTRRLFSTLNKYAKPVSKGEIVALDEDDVFAIVTRRLVEEFELLKSGIKKKTGFVSFNKTAPLNKTDQTSLTSILTLYDIAVTIHIPILHRQERKKKLQYKVRVHPDLRLDDVVSDVYNQQISYWTLLEENIQEYSELFKSKPSDRVAGKYRQGGGHFMFRPNGQKYFAQAVRIMMDRGESMEKAIQKLAIVPMNINEEPWKYIIWNPATERINSKVSHLLPESLLLYYVSQPPRDKKYDLLSEYRKVLDNSSVDLPGIQPLYKP